MSNKKIHIDYETLLLKFTEEFFVHEIYKDTKKKSNKKRQLTRAEKSLLLKTFFTKYFYNLFQKKNVETADFIFGKLRLVKENDEPYLLCYDNNLEQFEVPLKIDTNNVTSDLIFNLINNYKKFNDVGSLPDYRIFQKQNK